MRKKQEEIKGVDFKAFKAALEVLYKEKNIKEDVIFDAIEPAILAAYKKQNKLSNVRVELNRETCELKAYSYKTVVEDDYEKREEEELEKLEALKEYG